MTDAEVTSYVAEIDKFLPLLNPLVKEEKRADIEKKFNDIKNELITVKSCNLRSLAKLERKVMDGAKYYLSLFGNRFYASLKSSDAKLVRDLTAKISLDISDMEKIAKLAISMSTDSKIEQVNGRLERKFDDETAVDKLSRGQKRRANARIDSIGRDMMSLDYLTERLKKATSDKMRRGILKEIDGELKHFDRLARRISRLQDKAGHIDSHQRSLPVTRDNLIQARNRTILDKAYDPTRLNVLIKNLQTANGVLEAAMTAVPKDPDAIRQATMKVRAAENALYGRSITKKRSGKVSSKKQAKMEHYVKRLENLYDDIKDENAIGLNDYKMDDKGYRKAYKKYVKELYKNAKKVLNKAEAKRILKDLRAKKGYLRGASTIYMPANALDRIRNSVNTLGKA